MQNGPNRVIIWMQKWNWSVAVVFVVFLQFVIRDGCRSQIISEEAAYPVCSEACMVSHSSST